jgi:alkanesulfonate monooxygenase SsuD/methylene tetrahydromethanopterin reductase-like flavin-dependent oxidoreductase (luciferase family)
MARGIAVFAGIAPDVIRACARETEALGYGSFWVNHPPTIDGLAALAAAARESRRLELGVGVIPLHNRGPQSIMDGVRAHALPVERLLLGIGSAGPGALRRVRDGAAELRVLGCGIVVAALGPKMCRLGGEVADGVLLNWLTPAHARRSAQWVRDGAADRARRPRPAGGFGGPPRIMAYVRVAVGRAARDRLRGEAARYGAIPAYAANFERMGASPMDTCIAVDAPEDVPKALGVWDGVLDDLVIRVIPAADTAEDHLAVIRAAGPRSG